MAIKHTFFSITLITCAVSTLTALEQKTYIPTILNDGWSTKLDENGNTFFDYAVLDMLRKNSHTFPQTKVVKYKDETQTFVEKGTLKNHQIKKPRYKILEKYINRQNAILCPCTEEKFNTKNNELEIFATLLYNSRNPEHCALLQQKALELPTEDTLQETQELLTQDTQEKEILNIEQTTTNS